MLRVASGLYLLLLNLWQLIQFQSTIDFWHFLFQTPLVSLFAENYIHFYYKALFITTLNTCATVGLLLGSIFLFKKYYWARTAILLSCLFMSVIYIYFVDILTMAKEGSESFSLGFFLYLIPILFLTNPKLVEIIHGR